MHKTLPCLSFCAALLLAGFPTLSAQQTDRFAYAVTDINPLGANWSYLRKIDLQSGSVSQVLLDGTDQQRGMYNALTKKQLTQPIRNEQTGQAANAPFGTGVAAMAFDKAHNRLYFTPMLTDQLRYIDVRTGNVYVFAGNGLTGSAVKNADQGNIVTRMVITANGDGYAMTNDATQLIRFSTGKKAVIENLGAVVDDPTNQGISVHNACTSFGGDMIAGNDGKLYILSARNQVFRIDPSTKVATHLGMIQGLPADFSVNGAAVTPDNKILVSSALKTEYYTVSHLNWTATALPTQGSTWNASDLANSNLLQVTGEKEQTTTNTFTARGPVTAAATGTLISVYPNPVTDNQFVLQFNRLTPGTYSLQLTDMMGRQVVQQSISISGEHHVQPVKLDAASARGIYLVKITAQKNEVVYSSKIVVQ